MSKIFHITPLRLATFFVLSAPLAANAAIDSPEVAAFLLAVFLLINLLPGAIAGILAQYFTPSCPHYIGFGVFFAFYVAQAIYLTTYLPNYFSNSYIVLVAVIFYPGFNLGRWLVRLMKKLVVARKK